MKMVLENLSIYSSLIVNYQLFIVFFYFFIFIF